MLGGTDATCLVETKIILDNILANIPGQVGNLYTKQNIRFCNNMNNTKRAIKANRTLSMTIEGWQRLEEIANEWNMSAGRAMEGCVSQVWGAMFKPDTGRKLELKVQ